MKLRNYEKVTRRTSGNLSMTRSITIAGLVAQASWNFSVKTDMIERNNGHSGFCGPHLTQFAFLIPPSTNFLLYKSSLTAVHTFFSFVS